MANGMTVTDVLERVRERRRSKQCAECEGVVAIQGIRGEYRWTCLECEAVGFGYRSRTAARAAVRSS
ncbi:hypothetical protein [Halovivax cerinus]|uniref:Transposase zinc-ribbon domain-containing protein n=1 Tax=Halovivax cerinus TaxID=1487865 RepID=A0ABD5NKI2_9EURY|nr:hypothetical protein [Halovivax cerinus]